MPYHHEAEDENAEDAADTEQNGLRDAIAAVVLILLAVAAVSYYVAHM